MKRLGKVKLMACEAEKWSFEEKKTKYFVGKTFFQRELFKQSLGRGTPPLKHRHSLVSPPAQARDPLQGKQRQSRTWRAETPAHDRNRRSKWWQRAPHPAHRWTSKGLWSVCRLAGRHRLDSEEEGPGRWSEGLRALGRPDPDSILQAGHPPRGTQTGLDEYLLNEWQHPPCLGFLKIRHGQCITLKGHLQGITEI